MPNYILEFVIVGSPVANINDKSIQKNVYVLSPALANRTSGAGGAVPEVGRGQPQPQQPVAPAEQQRHAAHQPRAQHALPLAAHLHHLGLGAARCGGSASLHFDIHL